MVLEFLRGKYGLQLLMFLIIAIICWVICQLIGTIALFSFTDFSMQDLAQGDLIEVVKENENGYFILFTLLISQSIGLFIAPSLIFSRLMKNLDQPLIPFTTSKIGNFLILLPIYVVTGIVIVSFLGELNMKLTLWEVFHEMEKQATETVNYMLSFNDFTHLITTVILMAVIPAIGEELFFRGVIQKILTSWTKKNWIAILTTAFIFSAIHFQFLTFLPRFFMGILLGYLLVWSRSIWVPIIAHFLHNFISILVGIQNPENPEIDAEVLNYWIVLGAIIILVLVSYRYSSLYKKNYVSKI